MHREELTFEAVDDLVSAHARGRLGSSSELRFVPSAIGPLFELAFESTDGHAGPFLKSSWLDPSGQPEMRSALAGNVNVWLDEARKRGFMRTVYDPEKRDVERTGFLMAVRVAAGQVGLPDSAALSLTAAVRELESNIHEHSERPESGIIAFQARASCFEFVAADSGVGVLETLRHAPEFRSLNDHGRALHLALQENVSRHGRTPLHGNGFRDLFIGLTQLNADIRFRSGDHALTISGPAAELKQAQLAQKTRFQGLLASVRCQPMMPSHVSH
jgi:anti-sigma regulatory factor (Ser/Thr protein kinase)